MFVGKETRWPNTTKAPKGIADLRAKLSAGEQDVRGQRWGPFGENVFFLIKLKIKSKIQSKII